MGERYRNIVQKKKSRNSCKLFPLQFDKGTPMCSFFKSTYRAKNILDIQV